ncbi:helix-turn-helix domain-containing protein [Sphingomonas sp. NIBR02145]|uniref:winged helix-turn-helix transcriptional regulator n=1 Tax=Sphingomonas sp. NIBR02145 TaxID=3014784 RepID=UPI0022B2BD96|nr:helix-turn-helix domain-containing protein [Sphingomonas sp. NIBR02145]WHU02217.1 helix-turn-helix domain-containing protein [Sphingomonas sp. NIBR02145]
MPKLHDYDQVPGCTMYATLNLISGKWKGMILYHLMKGTMRFNALKRELGDCSQRLPIKQLRELEADGLVERTVYAVVPPRVDYSITEEGRSLEPILLDLRGWGEGWLRRRGLTARDDQTAPTLRP